MKRATKILSIALVLMLALSVMVLPASAAEPTVKIDVVSEYQGKTSGGYDYYKFSVYIDSTHSLMAYVLNITWDGAVWQVLRATNFADQNAFIANMVIDKNDPENNMYTASEAYMNYGGGNWAYDSSAGYLLMPGDGSNPTLAKISNTNMGTELTESGYTGFQTTWAGDIGDYMCLSGGSISGETTPMSGKQMVMSWYMRLKDGVAPGNYEVGVNAKQAQVCSAAYTHNDVGRTGTPTIDEKSAVPLDQFTYNNAFVKVGAAGPTVAKSKAELKFTLTSPTTVADPFTLRVTSVITDADWDAYFANTAVADATTDAIQRLGFVAYRGTDGFDMDTAKAVAQGTATEGYDVAWTDYIQKTSDTADAYFGARLEITSVDTRTDVTYVGVVEYLDANNQTAYAFYEAEQVALLNQNYETYVARYIADYGSTYVG